MDDRTTLSDLRQRMTAEQQRQLNELLLSMHPGPIAVPASAAPVAVPAPRRRSKSRKTARSDDADAPRAYEHAS